MTKDPALGSADLGLAKRLHVHLVVLPRWFALPMAVLTVILGASLGHAGAVDILLATLAVAGIMAWAHGMNTYLDYVWTGLDRGEVGERSRPKWYTSGQQPIAAGVLKSHEVLLSASLWLLLSALFAALLSARGHPWVWLPWTVASLCTFGYSWGKLHYSCEFFLALGFGPMATLLGMTASPDPDLIKGLLAGIPFGILFGFAAETVDQYVDAEVNWPKGLRNIGALTWKRQKPLSEPITLFIMLALAVHVLLAVLGTLSDWTLLATVPGLLFLILAPELAIPSRQKRAMFLGLVALSVYVLVMVVASYVS